MSKEKSPKANLRFARVFSAVSRGLKNIPPLDAAIVGENTVPGGWCVLNQSADQLSSHWFTHEGDKHGPRLPMPRRYRTVGSLAMQSEEADALHDAHPGLRAAVAIRFGEVALVAWLGDGLGFVPDPANPRVSLIGARIGRDDLTMTAGLWLPGAQELIVPESLELGRRMTPEAADALGMSVA